MSKSRKNRQWNNSNPGPKGHGRNRQREGYRNPRGKNGSNRAVPVPHRTETRRLDPAIVPMVGTGVGTGSGSFSNGSNGLSGANGYAHETNGSGVGVLDREEVIHSLATLGFADGDDGREEDLRLQQFRDDSRRRSNQNLGGEIGSSGLQRQNGLVYEEFLRELRGERAVRIFREMSDNDPVVGAVLFTIDMLIRQVKWRVTPASSSDADTEAADFLESARKDMSHTWEDFISEVLSMLTFGWSWFEESYKIRDGVKGSEINGDSSQYTDGRVGWRKIAGRAQESLFQWEFDEQGDVTHMVQRPWPDFKERTIPLNKSLLFRTRVRKGNPEGRSCLRNAYRPWYFKQRIEVIEGIGVERDLAGLPVAWVPAQWLTGTSLSPAESAALQAMKQMVVRIRRDEQEGVLMPLQYDKDGHKLYDLSLLSAGGSRQFDTDKIITRYDQRIAMTMLADFILLGHELVGSFALSSDKTNMFAIAIGAWLDMIAGVLNKYAVPRLFRLNSFSATQGRNPKYPEFTHGDIETPDLNSLGQYISQLSGAQFPLWPNAELKKYLLSVAGLPTPTDEELKQQESTPDSMFPPLPGEGEGLPTPEDVQQAPVDEALSTPATVDEALQARELEDPGVIGDDHEWLDTPDDFDETGMSLEDALERRKRYMRDHPREFSQPVPFNFDDEDDLDDNDELEDEDDEDHDGDEDN